MLLTDVVLGGSMDGLELSRKVKEKRPGIKILYMSGYPENVISNEVELDPKIELLEKPFRKDVLARKLRTVLGD